jgi:hypothetical protein
MLAMKRLLLILLLTVLPMQMAWAAAATYCQHERASTSHFGHHDHQHQLQADPTEKQDTPSRVHTDCGYCHGVIQAAFLTPALLSVTPSGAPHLEQHPPSFSSHIPDGPRRPDRRSVA